MNTTSEDPWPPNGHRTRWRPAILYFDWRDEPIVEEVLDSLDQLRTTIRCRAVAVVGFRHLPDMVMYKLIDPLPGPVTWDRDTLSATIDPCDDPERVAEMVAEEMEQVAFSVFGVAKLHLTDEQTYRTLINGLEDRRDQYVGEEPVIEF